MHRALRDRVISTYLLDKVSSRSLVNIVVDSLLGVFVACFAGIEGYRKPTRIARGKSVVDTRPREHDPLESDTGHVAREERLRQMKV